MSQQTTREAAVSSLIAEYVGDVLRSSEGITLLVGDQAVERQAEAVQNAGLLADRVLSMCEAVHESQEQPGN